ncbi:hypothetical protein ANN_19570 [Periplaneta americana]|uniref:Uncharacterized protein n=1 Tax=Periplaneta americana TaxID=6978 RepID=A0ABQ8SA85_PERAM|nr:hypothetical protein ANN_19570 [Periplaneta americana]
MRCHMKDLQVIPFRPCFTNELSDDMDKRNEACALLQEFSPVCRRHVVFSDEWVIYRSNQIEKYCFGQREIYTSRWNSNTVYHMWRDVAANYVVRTYF